MNDQMLLELDAKHTGATRALDAAPQWRDRARTAIDELAATGRAFIADDLVALVGLPHGEPGVNRSNAVGAAFLAAKTRGVIRATGNRRPTRRVGMHGRYVTEWIGVGS